MADVVHEPVRERPGAALFLDALASAWRRPSAWGIYLVGVLSLTLPALLVTQRAVGSMIGNRYAPGERLHHFDAAFRVDHAGPLERLTDTLGTLAGPLALVALFLGIVAAGGWLAVLLEGPERPSARRFLGGGVRYFWRFVRVALAVLLLLSAARWLLFGWPFERLLVDGFGLARPELTLFESEATAQRLGWARDGLHLVLVGLVMAWALYTRTRLALQGSSSVVLAGFASLWTLLRHPLRTLRPLLLIYAVEFLVVAVACGALARLVDASLADDPAAWRVGALALVTLLSLVASSIVFGARYAATTAVARSLVKPLPRPDPWRDRVGPPGGPQYPIGGHDEFSVSV